MEAISGRKTIQEIAADHAIHPIQVSQWKRQLLDGASELFTRGKKSKGVGRSASLVRDLPQAGEPWPKADSGASGWRHYSMAARPWS